MTDSRDAAEKIMDLVDEFPTGPLSLERRQILDRIEILIAQHTQQIDYERDESFDLGYEEGHSEGFSEGYRDAEEEFSQRVADLETEVNDLEIALSDAEKLYEQGIADGIVSRGN